MSSLPVPLSPVMSTLALVGATLSISLKSRCIGGLCADHLVARLDARARRPRPSRADSLRGAEDVLDADQDALAVERLLEEVARAELDGRDRVVHRRVPADDDDRALAWSLRPCGGARAPRARSCPGSFTSKMARSTGRVRAARGSASASSARLGLDDLVALALEHELERAADVLLVVDDEHARGGRIGFDDGAGLDRSHGGQRLLSLAIHLQKEILAVVENGARRVLGERPVRTSCGRRLACAS